MKPKANKQATIANKPQVKVQDLTVRRNPKAGKIMERYDQSAKNVILSMRG